MANKELDTFSYHRGQLEISIDGIGEDGTPCWWSGFDKIKGTFWGTTKKPNVNQPNKT